MNRICLVAVLSVVVIVLSAASTPQDSMEKRVTALESAVKSLEERFDTLEKKLKAGPSKVAADKETWRNLKKGMTKDEVRKLLGEPEKVDAASYGEYWYYEKGGNLAQGPRVEFDPSKGTVMGWKEPD